MDLIRRIEKVHAYIFYVFVRDFTNEWGAALVISVLQFIMVLGVVCGVALVTKHTPLSIPKLVAAIVYFAIYVVTQFFLVRGHWWRRFQAEFEQFSKTKSDGARMAVWAGVVVTSLGGIAIIKIAIGAPMI
jgi:hypothetical protein